MKQKQKLDGVVELEREKEGLWNECRPLPHLSSQIPFPFGFSINGLFTCSCKKMIVCLVLGDQQNTFFVYFPFKYLNILKSITYYNFFRVLVKNYFEFHLY